MRETVLARRYAGALFELARERGILDTVVNDVASFGEALEGNASLRYLLNSPDIGKREKRGAVEELFQDRVSNVFFNFVLVLLKKNRQELFDLIGREFRHFYDRHRKKLRASTVTAVPLDRSSETRLRDALSQAFDADVEIQNLVDRNIMGGVIVHVDGRVFDCSLRGQLNRLKARLIRNGDGRR